MKIWILRKDALKNSVSLISFSLIATSCDSDPESSKSTPLAMGDRDDEQRSVTIGKVSLVNGLTYEKKVLTTKLGELEQLLPLVSEIQFPPGVQVSPPADIAWFVQIQFSRFDVSESTGFLILENKKISGLEGSPDTLVALEDWFRKRIDGF